MACAAAVMLTATGMAQAQPRAVSARTCGTVVARGVRFDVTIKKGRASCATARKVLWAFMSGRGRRYGPANGPAYLQTWSVNGWSCGHGTGGGACIRGGRTYRTATNYILAQAR